MLTSLGNSTVVYVTLKLEAARGLEKCILYTCMLSDVCYTVLFRSSPSFDLATIICCFISLFFPSPYKGKKLTWLFFGKNSKKKLFKKC